MKFWIDDIRPAPDGYIWCKSVTDAKIYITYYVRYKKDNIEIIDIDHDAGDYAKDVGDYIKILDWMEMMGYSPNAIHIHSMNPVGVKNMRRIIRKNGWTEI